MKILELDNTGRIMGIEQEVIDDVMQSENYKDILHK